MIVTGQTLDSIFLKIPHNDTLVWWSLSNCVVVKNLGVDILIGEPGKVDNEIVTKPHLKQVETKDVNEKLIRIY